MWKKFSLLLVSLSVTVITVYSTQQSSDFESCITDQAQQWMQRCAITSDNKLLINQHDLQLLLNVFYFSYQRSLITLQSQKKAIILLQQIWQGWQNIACRRRNPSKKLAYPDCTISCELCNSFDELRKKHERISTTYDLMLEVTTKGQLFEDQLLKKNIEYIKDQARIVVTNALLDVQNHVSELSRYMQSKRSMDLDEVDTSDDNDEAMQITRSKIYEYIKEQLPTVAVQSFARSDNAFIAISQKNWDALLMAQELSNIIWHAVETKRAQFYLIYYRLLYEKTRLLQIQPFILFNEKGLINTSDTIHYLPNPELLTGIA